MVPPPLVVEKDIAVAFDLPCVEVGRLAEVAVFATVCGRELAIPLSGSFEVQRAWSGVFYWLLCEAIPSPGVNGHTEYPRIHHVWTVDSRRVYETKGVRLDIWESGSLHYILLH